MNSLKLLKKLGINPDEPILVITAEEALENLLEAINEYCPHLNLEKISKEDLLTLLKSYANSVVLYHPENYHQERGALIENFEMLEKYGLKEEDFNSIDFS